MAVIRALMVGVLLLPAAGTAHAQDRAPAMSPLDMAVACAPPPVAAPLERPALRVMGSQDTIQRTLYGTSDLLIVNAGAAKGIALNQEFFVRHTGRAGATYGVVPTITKTSGVVRIVAVNDTTAIASVEIACDGIVQYDYLEPFALPAVPADADRITAGEPDFSTLAHVTTGDEQRATGGAGDFMLIDWGADHNVAPGGHVAIYRDVKMPGMPLSSIGDAIVVSVGSSQSLTRITRARDAVRTGDYVAIRK